MAIITLGLIFMLCGCAGYREIDRGYLVTAIGFSTDEDKATVFIEALSSSNKDKPSERVVLSGSGKDVSDAYKILKEGLVKPLYFEQTGTAFFENTSFKVLEEIPDINLDIYLVKTQDAKAIFENNTADSVMGYDIITLIKTQEKERKIKISTQLYRAKNGDFDFPIVNFADGALKIKQAEGK